MNWYQNNSLNESINQLTEPSSYSLNLFEWCLLFISILIFIIGIIGNLLVVIVVLKNSQMRTITNIFIVNLAIGDFFVILICLPPTMINDLSGTWWFGKTMCKIIPYVQYISVCISVLTLTSISYERYYAIVYPLKFKASKFRAKIIILIIWIFAILINLPHPIVITMKRDTSIFYCYPTWEQIYQNIFDLTIFLILYILPMALIFYTYSRVLKVLWRLDKSIAWNENDEKKSLTKSNAQKSAFRSYSFRSKSNIDDISITVASGSSNARSKMKNQLIARRKAAKMLIIVATMFGVCYLPIHLLNILRFTGSNLLENALGAYANVIFQIAHCLVYLNSCINPLIYHVMSASRYLMQVDLTVQKKENCLIQYIDIDQFCAGNIFLKKDTCNGDSGGPILKFINNRWTLVGIVSNGDVSCAGTGIYINVAFFYDWILQKSRL